MSKLRKKIDWAKVLGALLGTLMVLTIFAIIFLTRYYMAGGDWNCAIAQDPALCKVIKEFNE